MQILINEARARYESRVSFHFGSEATQIDLARKQVWSLSLITAAEYLSARETKGNVF